MAADDADSSATSEEPAGTVMPMIPLPTFVWAHDPVTEQLRATPIPLHVTVNPGVAKDIGEVVLHFQFHGQEQWHSKAMVLGTSGDSEPDTLVARIECSDGIQGLDPDEVHYYITFTNTEGTLIGQEPAPPLSGGINTHVVKMVDELEDMPPSLPGEAPEIQCEAHPSTHGRGCSISVIS